MAITEDRDKVRLTIGDTDATDPLLQDDEVAYFLELQDNDVKLASASAAEAIAAKYARGYTFATDGQTFNRSDRVKHYMQLAAVLDPTNARSGNASIYNSATTRIDAYSDDIGYDELTSSSRVGRVRAGYTDPDLPD